MIKVKTQLLQSMVNKALKVCSFNKMLPLTELLEININGEELTIRATDNLTNLYLIQRLEGNQETMRVVVDANIFSALVTKTTTEFVELFVSENSLTFTGNGVYYLDIRIDETGEVIKFPELKVDRSKAVKELQYKELVKRMNVCKSAVPDNFDAPELNNYYLKGNIIATNAFKVTSVENIEELKNEELFINKDFGRIMIDLEYDKAKYYVEDNQLVILNDEFIVTSIIGEDLEKYPLDSIKQMLDQTFTYECIIFRKDILALLDRLMLFVGEYDSKSVNLTFLPDKINLTSIKKTGDESVEYKKKPEGDLVAFSCLVNIEHLKEQLEALLSEDVIVQFGGADNALKIIDGNITQIISLMDGE